MFFYNCKLQNITIIYSIASIDTMNKNHEKRIQEYEDMLRQLELVSKASVYVEMETLRREAQMKLYDSVREELK